MILRPGSGFSPQSRVGTDAVTFIMVSVTSEWFPKSRTWMASMLSLSRRQSSNQLGSLSTAARNAFFFKSTIRELVTHSDSLAPKSAVRLREFKTGTLTFLSSWSRQFQTNGKSGFFCTDRRAPILQGAVQTIPASRSILQSRACPASSQCCSHPGTWLQLWEEAAMHSAAGARALCFLHMTSPTTWKEHGKSTHSGTRLYSET